VVVGRLERLVDPARLTVLYTRRAPDSIARNAERPFLLYLAHSMPHTPLGCAEDFRGTSSAPYGDVIRELDATTGRILDALERLGIDDRTLVVYTSDNGPWLNFGPYAGSALPLREGKGTSFEGGVRVPFVARWPGHIPKGAEKSEPAMTIDVLPTLAALTGAAVPSDRIIDGKDIWPLLSGQKDAKSPHEAYYFYWGRELHAIRSGKWKLHFPHVYRSLTGTPGRDGKPGGYSQQRTGLALYDLEAEVGEKNDVAVENPEVVARLTELAERAREDLGDALVKRQGSGVREPGKL
jgi:arylsulfatase A-like enzyme